VGCGLDTFLAQRSRNSIANLNISDKSSKSITQPPSLPNSKEIPFSMWPQRLIPGLHLSFMLCPATGTTYLTIPFVSSIRSTTLPFCNECPRSDQLISLSLFKSLCHKDLKRGHTFGEGYVALREETVRTECPIQNHPQGDLIPASFLQVAELPSWPACFLLASDRSHGLPGCTFHCLPCRCIGDWLTLR
jgi:hypothetical protein